MGRKERDEMRRRIRAYRFTSEDRRRDYPREPRSRFGWNPGDVRPVCESHVSYDGRTCSECGRSVEEIERNGR